MLTIRPETPEDHDAIWAVHVDAFPENLEARLVNLLRESGDLRLSLVAGVDGKVVGHLAFSPVSVDGAVATPPGLGLAPVGVMRDHQNQGIGTKLTEAGLDLARQHGYPFCVVLGHPQYYPRFGFRRASECGLMNEYGADEAFMAMELQARGLDRVQGLVKYCKSFELFAPK